MNPKTQERIVSIHDAAMDYALGKLNTTQFMKLVETALKEQDRDTRHACAVAVSSLPLSGYKGDPVAFEVLNMAHAACMNTQAV